MTDQLKQLDFLNANHWKIIQEAFKHRDKIGYLYMYVNEEYSDFKSGIHFEEGEFSRDDFTEIKKENPKDYPGEIVEADYIYYSIRWTKTETKNDIKELALTGRADPNDLIRGV